MVARGYTEEAGFIQRIEAVLADLNKN
jgi:hypothetical protein